MSRTYKLKQFIQSPTMLLFWAYLAMAVGNLPVILLPIFAKSLGVWWFILLVLYINLWNSAYALIMRPREMARLRYMLGDEAFFLLYPKEKQRELRRLERRRKSIEKQHRQHMMRHEPVF